jgi:hypothetical protein
LAAVEQAQEERWNLYLAPLSVKLACFSPGPGGECDCPVFRAAITDVNVLLFSKQTGQTPMPPDSLSPPQGVILLMKANAPLFLRLRAL